MDKQASAEDIWDDTLLVKAYDNSVKLEQAELAKRIAQSTNKLTQSVHIASGSGGIKNSKSKKETDEKPIFKVGSYVRATYQDQIDYEAKIIAIDDNNQKCTIRYIGYDNEEEVMLTDLIESWGKKERSLQFAQAKQEENPSDHQIKNDKKNPQNLPSIGVNNLPPPPPMPPILNDLNEESEHISAMLMAWYMSGYYTGLYQGQKLSKSKNKK